jgi:hypothetical protein
MNKMKIKASIWALVVSLILVSPIEILWKAALIQGCLVIFIFYFSKGKI